MSCSLGLPPSRSTVRRPRPCTLSNLSVHPGTAPVARASCAPQAIIGASRTLAEDPTLEIEPPSELGRSGNTNPRSIIPPVTGDIGVVNLLSVSRTTGCIDDDYVVDPELDIPSELLPEGGSAGPGPNLSLESQNSFIDSSVFVLPVKADGRTLPGGNSRTHLVFSARDRVEVLLSNLGNIPCTIEATSVRDSVQVEIPRGFVGLVTTDSARPPRMPARKCVPLSEAGGKRRYFVGPRPPSAAWHGTELHIEAPRGSIDVHFVDERPAISFRAVFTAIFLLLWFTYDCEDQCSFLTCRKTSSSQCAWQFLWSGRLQLLVVSALVYRYYIADEL